MRKIEFTFNWFYADKDDIAMFSSGRLPVRHPHVDLGLPTNGTGKYEWRGFLSQDKHPHGTDAARRHDRELEQQAGAGWQAADDNWGYGSVHRNDLLERTVDPPATHTLASTVGAMNRAATQDLRSVKALRGDAVGARDRPAPRTRASQQMFELLAGLADAGIEPPRPATSTARSTTRRRRSWTRHGRRSRTP